MNSHTPLIGPTDGPEPLPVPSVVVVVVKVMLLPLSCTRRIGEAAQSTTK
jgi:hypothetical protein